MPDPTFLENRGTYPQRRLVVMDWRTQNIEVVWEIPLGSVVITYRPHGPMTCNRTEAPIARIRPKVLHEVLLDAVGLDYGPCESVLCDFAGTQLLPRH